MNEQQERNAMAYQQMKEMIRQRYPKGWFVGIADGGIVADASGWRELNETLRLQGRDPRLVFVVEAGVDYPEYATILLEVD